MEDVQIVIEQEAKYLPDSHKRSRDGKMRSKVWQHFTKILKDDGKCDKCQCNHCHKLFTCSSRSGTTHLLRHITEGICPVFKKDPSPANGLLPWKSDRPALTEGPVGSQLRVEPTTWAGEFRECVAKLVELANGKVQAGLHAGPPVGSPDYSISAVVRCLNEMEDISQSSEMYLDAFEILQDVGERECFVCLPPEPRRRWLQRVLHRRHPLRYLPNV